MAINNWVLWVKRHRGDLILQTLRREPRPGDLPGDPNLEGIVIRDATIEPMRGDFLHFGSAATQLPDGSYSGGGGFIAMDGNEFPYRRISTYELVENW